MDHSADYIVAGAGSAGCVLARRLAETGASVILLEAGGPDRTRLVRKPGMIAIFHNVPALKKRLDWGYYTAPQAGALGRRIPQPRGRVLGGSGSINGMVFVRGNRKNYDDWAVAGCKGWSLRRRTVQLQANGGLGGRRQRAARRRRPGQGDQAEGPDPGLAGVHRGARRDRRREEDRRLQRRVAGRRVGLPAERQRRAALQLLGRLPGSAQPAGPHRHHPRAHHPGRHRKGRAAGVEVVTAGGRETSSRPAAR